MNAAPEAAPLLSSHEERRQLAQQWRGLTRAATIVALLTSPAAFMIFHREVGWSVGMSILGALGSVIAFRGLIDLGVRKLIPWPSLFGVDEAGLREEDVVNRRRAWHWRWWFVATIWLLVINTIVWQILQSSNNPVSWVGTPGRVAHQVGNVLPLVALLPIYLLFNFVILMGPLLIMGISQIRGFEPGDADWGVRLDHVRGQAEAKEEVRRVVNLWQSGEAFEKAGGKRERGILFHGPPGTGKTMLAKAIATGFNAPIVTIPGSGFAQTFIGMDAVIVRFLARKAKKLAAKWGGQCIVFIDEIDAVGMRRAALGPGGPGSMTPPSIHDYSFFGPFGALNPTGDLILETRAWRDKLFAFRAPEPPRRSPGRLQAIVNQFPGGMFGGGTGQLALNQLLVVMDGIDNPPWSKRFVVNKVNKWLDASYIVPRRIGRVSVRLPHVRPTNNQIYFIGATNVPINMLDPALTRPGRMGRHVWFRTPTKKDRVDIFDLYLGKVAHDPDLDRPERRDELARITNGYAQPLDANLLTPTGWKRMGDIQVGDLLVGADGQPTQVHAVHPRGEMEVFRVTFNDGTFTECTADHLWTVEANDPRMRPQTLRLAEIVDRGVRWSPGGSRFYLPKLAPVRFEGTAEPPLDPYFLGLLLGDGGFTSTTPDFCSADEENVAAVSALAPAGVALSQHGPMNWWLSSGPRGGTQRGRVNPLTENLGQLGLWGVRGHDKFVPEGYKRASAEDRLSVLQGLMDTDGTRDYRRGTGAAFNSHSRRLTEDVAFLVRSLGGSARIRSKGEGWRIAIDLPDGLIPFRLPRKAEECRASRRPFRKRILTVESAGRKIVQCVTVAAADGLYVTDGFTVTHNSPAMVEQVCSMALTYAHHEFKERFEWEHITEAMVTVESGTAVGVEYIPEETRAVAIHEAGHAVTAHVYMKGAESTRLSIRMRGGSLGHHQALEKDERFSSWRTEEMGHLVWTLGAMAAENVFYGENATGVGGDLFAATTRAGFMVGVSGMGPDQPHLNGSFANDFERERARRRIMKRFEEIGNQLMNRSGAGGPADVEHNPVGAVLADRYKRVLAAQILGQAYVQAFNTVRLNKDAADRIADTLIERKEIYGDELVGLLDSCKLKKPEIDLTAEETWPTL